VVWTQLWNSFDAANAVSHRGLAFPTGSYPCVRAWSLIFSASRNLRLRQFAGRELQTGVTCVTLEKLQVKQWKLSGGQSGLPLVEKESRFVGSVEIAFAHPLNPCRESRREQTIA